MRRLGVAVTRRTIASIVTVGLLVAVAAPVAAQTPPVPGPPAGGPPAATEADAAQAAAAAEALAAATARLDAGTALLDRASSRSAVVDGRVRRAEEALVDLIVERRLARDRSQAADDAEAVAAAVVVTRQEVVTVEHDRFEARAARAYKFGSAGQSALAFSAIGNASSPTELARTLHELRAVVGAQLDRLERADALLAWALASRAEVVVIRDHARVDLAIAERRVEAVETELVDLRRRADEAEARWVRVAAQTLDLEGSVADAAATLAPLAVTEVPPRPAPPEETPQAATLEDRRAELAGRVRSLGLARALDPARRRARDDLVCPVDLATFADDWHQPRADERRHEGTDLFADRGTPVRAVADGVITEVDRVDRFDGRHDLGGVTVTYEIGPDEHIYNAHLDSARADLEPGMVVFAGEVIGWVGTTGNARETPPHLHLGWYVEGAAINPYVSLAVACGSQPAVVTP